MRGVSKGERERRRRVGGLRDGETIPAADMGVVVGSIGAAGNGSRDRSRVISGKLIRRERLPLDGFVTVGPPVSAYVTVAL